MSAAATPDRIRFAARYYDGRSASATQVSVEVGPEQVMSISVADGRLDCELSEVSLGDRLGNTRRFIRLPSGGTLETDDNAAVDRLAAELAPRRRRQWIYRLERSWPIAVASLLCTVAAIWVLLTFGVPAASERLAHRVPAEVETSMGEETLDALDSHLLEPTTLDEPEQMRVTVLFDSLNEDPTMRLELRSAPAIGANAFALPSGIVIVTDELVALAEEEDELAAVIAHELGHVHHRHIMRSVIQNSATALLLASLVGDLSSITGLAATLPTFLMEARYSREFELEADRHAALLMAAKGRDVHAIKTVLKRLGADEQDDGTQDASDVVVGYLSSHPATRERVEALDEILSGIDSKRP